MATVDPQLPFEPDKIADLIAEIRESADKLQPTRPAAAI